MQSKVKIIQSINKINVGMSRGKIEEGERKEAGNYKCEERKRKCVCG